MKIERNTIYDGMYGLAVADALGVPYETASLQDMQSQPCAGMTGYGFHNQPAGTWSDDTSMSLCVADSLSRGYDPEDIMKKFRNWKRYGEYTATGKVFDVGNTCRKSINQYQSGVPVELCGNNEEDGNGNGGLMRTFPISLYQCLCSERGQNNLDEFLEPIHRVSSLTHAHEIGLICCGLFSLVLKEWLDAVRNKPLIDEICEDFNKYFYGESDKAVIDNFQKEFAFLRMKTNVRICLEGSIYTNAAAAYYALSVPEEHRKGFAGIDAHNAKKQYKNVPHLEMSDELISKRLYTVLTALYEQNDDMRKRLISTCSKSIIYDTTGSHDNTLGRCRCSECVNTEHKNLYGKAIMRIREEMRLKTCENATEKTASE